MFPPDFAGLNSCLFVCMSNDLTYCLIWSIFWNNKLLWKIWWRMIWELSNEIYLNRNSFHSAWETYVHNFCTNLLYITIFTFSVDVSKPIFVTSWPISNTLFFTNLYFSKFRSEPFSDRKTIHNSRKLLLEM